MEVTCLEEIFSSSSLFLTRVTKHILAYLSNSRFKDSLPIALHTSPFPVTLHILA